MSAVARHVNHLSWIVVNAADKVCGPVKHGGSCPFYISGRQWMCRCVLTLLGCSLIKEIDLGNPSQWRNSWQDLCHSHHIRTLYSIPCIQKTLVIRLDIIHVQYNHLYSLSIYNYSVIITEWMNLIRNQGIFQSLKTHKITMYCTMYFHKKCIIYSCVSSNYWPYVACMVRNAEERKTNKPKCIRHYSFRSTCNMRSVNTASMINHCLSIPLHTKPLPLRGWVFKQVYFQVVYTCVIIWHSVVMNTCVLLWGDYVLFVHKWYLLGKHQLNFNHSQCTGFICATRHDGVVSHYRDTHALLTCALALVLHPPEDNFHSLGSLLNFNLSFY